MNNDLEGGIDLTRKLLSTFCLKSFKMRTLNAVFIAIAFPHWNWCMLCHIYVADRLTLNNKNASRTKEIGVHMWRTAYPNSTISPPCTL